MSNSNDNKVVVVTFYDVKRLCVKQLLDLEEFTDTYLKVKLSPDDIFQTIVFLLNNGNMKVASYVINNNFKDLNDRHLCHILQKLYEDNDVFTSTLNHNLCKKILDSNVLNVNQGKGLQLLVAAKENFIDHVERLLKNSLVCIYSSDFVLDSTRVSIVCAPLYVAWKFDNYKIAKILIKKVMDTGKQGYTIEDCKITAKFVTSKGPYNAFLDINKTIIEAEKVLQV